MKKWDIGKTWRTLKKNGDKISKGVSVVLFLLLVAAIVWAADFVKKEDAARKAAIQPIAANSPIKANRARKYGDAGFNLIAENEYLILSADFTNGDVSVEVKESGKVWYSNPPTRNDSGIKGVKSRMNSQLLYTSYNVNTDKENTYESFTASVRQGGLDYKLVDNGIEFLYSFPATGVIIPLKYTLVGDSLEVSIPEEDLQELWSEYYVVYKLDVLPYFGTATMDEEGYILIPDGSGSLVELNSDKYTFSQYSNRVYGQDPGVGEVRVNTVFNQITMPVFGIKANDDAWIGVITSGAATSRIYSFISQKASSFNQVYPQLQRFSYELKSGNVNMNMDDNVKSVNDRSDNGLRGIDYTIRYFFLSDEKANYSGMSERYQQYLKDEGQLKDSELAEKQHLILDIYGGVTLSKVTMGIRHNVIEKLTGYTDVVEMVRTLKERGVENIIINYIGGLKGGYEYTIQDDLKPEPALGTAKEFQAMLEYLEQEGVEIFFETNPIQMYTSVDNAAAGYSKLHYATERGFESYAYGQSYQPQGVESYISEGSWNFITPRQVPGILKKFVDSANEWNINNFSMDLIGETLYTEQKDGDASTTREEEIALWSDMINGLSDEMKYFMVHTGNMYTAEYADIITDVAMSSSEYDSSEWSIPFNHMTLKGNVVMGTTPINTNSDYDYAFLQAMEAGASLKFNVMASDADIIVGTKYNRFGGYVWEYWVDVMVEQYHKMQEITGKVAGEEIVAHEMLEDGLVKTTYESGSSVIVNYNETACTYQGTEIAGRDCTFLEGNAK